ncbi:MAG: hypothetical protein J6S40_02235 [Thermoguttaceae bacterium]|nr:hypothetical protein [Thermoguttaceae bacterium]
MKFAPIIKLRENTRDRQQMEVAAAVSEESALRARAARLDEELRTNLEKWREAETRRPVPLDELRLFEARRRELTRRKEETLRELTLAAEKTNRARGRLGEAVKNVRVLENLRDRRQAEADAAEKREREKDFRENHLCK